ncbi:MAG: hypothetical protein AAFR93_01445 [Pseudomonadota bacterium]
MIRAPLIALALFATLPAHGLSCLAPNAARGFNFAAQSEDRYHMLSVTFEGEGPFVPPVKMEDQGKPRAPVVHSYEATATFYHPNGPAVTRDITLVVEVTCLGMWCGAFPAPGSTALMFAEPLSRSTYRLRLGPCPDDLVLFEPSKAQIETLLGCWRQGLCGSEALAQFERF